MLGALWVLAGSCWATELPWAARRCNTRSNPLHGAAAAGMEGNHRFDLVIVEAKGRGPRGFRFQIVLDSATWGTESLLELAADEAGLVVTARDVDGIGNDLDLIVKSAKSFTPVGVWINDHHGGFTKADASVYASSIWSDGPRLFSLNPPNTFLGAILLWHQSYIQPATERFPGEGWTSQGVVEPRDFDAPTRLTEDPQHARGPPSRFAIIHF